MGSHVWSGGSTHMGAGSWLLLALLFRMIPRFPPTPSARECATHTTPGHASTSPGLRVVRVNMRATTGPRPHRGDGVRPISTRGTTDLGTECDRSRRGTGPISTRNRTDLDAEPDRSRRKGRRVRRAGRQAGGQAVRSLRLPAAPATRSSTTASTRQTPGPTHGPPGPSRSRAPPLAPAVPASSTGR